MTITARDIYQKYAPGTGLVLKLEDKEVSGSLMPFHDFTSPGMVILKMAGGYNVGVHESQLKEVLLQEPSACENAEELASCLGESPKIQPSQPREELSWKRPRRRPKVAIVTMGGTIASTVEYSTGAVKAMLEPEQLLMVNPALGDIAELSSVSVCNILSENLSPDHVARAAEAVGELIGQGVDGIVVTHGTDTMGYSAALMSFMLPQLPVPVVFVGSQRSSDRPSSDAFENLYDAVLVAGAGRPGVMVVMHGSSSDTYSVVHRGCKVRKLHSSKRDAFQSINCDLLARIYKGWILWTPGCEEFFALQGSRSGRGEDYQPETNWHPKVTLCYAHPGLSSGVLGAMLRGSDGVVFAGTGFGHISEEHFSVIEEFMEKGGVGVMCTQCLSGTVNLNVYTGGRELLSRGMIPGGDMLPETAVMKLMWAMAKTKDREEIERIMTSNLRGELTKRRFLRD